jgi:hypothetical protein
MKRTETLQIRLSIAEHAALKAAAADCGMSEFVRQALAPWLADPRTPAQRAQDAHRAEVLDTQASDRP